MDQADETGIFQELLDTLAIAKAQEAVRAMPVGVAGECNRCAEESPRLVRGVCAPCRDKFNLP